MRKSIPLVASAVGLTLALHACSSGAEKSGSAASGPETEASSSATFAPAASPDVTETGDDVTADAAPSSDASAQIITLRGLGNLRIGQKVPQDGSWTEAEGQVSDACRTVSSRRYPGVYAIVTDGLVQRITVGKRSDVKLAQGIGVGADKKDVVKSFGGFQETPHKYQPAPAQYLTAPNAVIGEPALRFEVEPDGKVGLIHVGAMPVLAYVEGCA